MGQCKLSDRQRDLLRLIVQGMQQLDGPVVWWIRMAHDHSIPQWQNVEDAALREQLQADTLLGDVAMFERCGFIVNAQPGRYDLVASKIVEAVESDFFSESLGDYRVKDTRRGKKR